MKALAPASLGLLLGALVSLAPGCAKARAHVEPEPPALEAPAPPPRLVAPLEAEPLRPTNGVTDELPTRSPVRATPKSGGARGDPSRPDANRPEPAKPEGAPKAEPLPDASRPPETGADGTSQLRTLQPGNDAELERSIRDLLGRASRNLNRVDYGALSVDAKAQYDTAKRFIQQADDAIRAKNFVFAGNLADKAAALAAVLLGR